MGENPRSKTLDDVLESLTQTTQSELSSSHQQEPQTPRHDYVANEVLADLFPSAVTHQVHDVHPLIEKCTQESSSQTLQPQPPLSHPALHSQMPDETRPRPREKLASVPPQDFLMSSQTDPLPPPNNNVPQTSVQVKHQTPQITSTASQQHETNQDLPKNPPLSLHVEPVLLSKPQLNSLMQQDAPTNSNLDTPNPQMLTANADESLAYQDPQEPTPPPARANLLQAVPRCETANQPIPLIATSQVTASQSPTEASREELALNPEGVIEKEKSTSEPVQAQEPKSLTETNVHENSNARLVRNSQSRLQALTKNVSEMNEDELMDEEDRLLDAKEKGLERNDEPVNPTELVLYPLTRRAALLQNDIQYYSTIQNGVQDVDSDSDSDVQFVAFSPSKNKKKSTQTGLRKPPVPAQSKTSKKFRSDFSSSSDDAIVQVSVPVREKKKKPSSRKNNKSTRTRAHKESSDLDFDWKPEINANLSDDSDDSDDDDVEFDSDLDADDYEDFSGGGYIQKERPSPLARKRLRRNQEYSETDSQSESEYHAYALRWRKKKRRNFVYSSHDNERNFRTRRKKMSHKRRRFRDYDSESESEEELKDPLWQKREDDARAALDGNEAPFPDPIVCVICRAAGNRPLGTRDNAWRDGFVQPKHNFSVNVQRGIYGKRMTAEFCLQHTAGDQNYYIEHLQDIADKIPNYLGPDNDEDGQRENRSSESELEQQRGLNHRHRNTQTSPQNISSDDDSDEDYVVEEERPNVVSLRKFSGNGGFKYTSYSSSSDSESPEMKEDKPRPRAKNARNYGLLIGKKKKTTGSEFENDGFIITSADEETTPAGNFELQDISQEVENDPLWIARRKQVDRELDGEQAPFKNAIICVICKYEGIKPLGTKNNYWRDGYIQPASNFSNDVQRGNYGKYMKKPFCAHHKVQEQRQLAPTINKLIDVKKRRINKKHSLSPGTSTSAKARTPLSPPTPRALSSIDDEDVITIDYSKQPQAQARAYNVNCVCPHCTHCRTVRSQATK